MSVNVLTGVQITDQDMLLIVGDQAVTIAVLRQQVGDLQTQLMRQQQQYESVMKTLAIERDEAVGLGG